MSGAEALVDLGSRERANGLEPSTFCLEVLLRSATGRHSVPPATAPTRENRPVRAIRCRYLSLAHTQFFERR